MQLIPYICTTCGVQYEPSENPPAHCPICEDDRQYIGLSGQNWATLQQINAQHKNIIELVAPDIYAIYTTPSFGIGQRAHLITTPGGNILWDCISNLDSSTVDLVKKLGGIQAIAISHPHYFSTIVEWSHQFDRAPVYINALDVEWLGRNDEVIQLWNEPERILWEDITIICCGGHFPGASVLYWPAGKGALFTGDTIQVAPDRKTVSFMYSYPNLIPLSEKDILQIQASLQSVMYDAMYGAFGLYIREKAQAATEFSIKRYLEIIRKK